MPPPNFINIGNIENYFTESCSKSISGDVTADIMEHPHARHVCRWVDFRNLPLLSNSFINRAYATYINNHSPANSLVAYQCSHFMM